MSKRTYRDVKVMSASQINKELDGLDKRSSRNVQAFIDAGRGWERPSEYLKKDDPLAREARDIFDRSSDLHNEIARRYGPGASSRLPKGFRPIRTW